VAVASRLPEGESATEMRGRLVASCPSAAPNSLPSSEPDAVAVPVDEAGHGTVAGGAYTDGTPKGQYILP
jgi:hypothetical protein